MADTTPITVETTVNVPIAKAWACWTEPACIMQWNAASDDWHTPRATNDPRTGGKFSARMEAKDGSMGFDFEGVYSEVVPEKHIAYAMADGRKVTVTFTAKGGKTHVVETFDPETENPPEFQKAGWQSIIDNYAKHVAAHR